MGYPTPPGLSGAQAPLDLDWTQSPRARTVSVKAVSASAQFFTGLGHLVSFNYAETSGTAKVLAYLHDGTDNTGQIVACLASAASGSGGSDPGLPGFYFQNGLYLEIVSGALSLAASVVPLVDQEPN